MKADLLTPAAPAQDEWPKLVPLNNPDLPRLDPTHIPGWAGDFVRALADTTETPPELAAAMVLSTCAAAAARRLNVAVRSDFCEPGNLWMLVALPSGNRKSAVQAQATSPLATWERDQASILAPEIGRIISERKTMEARAKEARNKSAKQTAGCKANSLAKEAADIEADLPEIPVSPKLWTSDVTPEQLASLLADHNECMAWLSSEGGIFDLLQGRYSNGIPNLDLVLKAHSGDSDRVDRRTRESIFLENPRLTIGLSPQPDVLRGLAAKPGFRGRGLLARFLYLIPDSPLGYRTLGTQPMPKSVRDAYSAGIHAMLDWKPVLDEHGKGRPHTCRLSEQAQAEHHAFSLGIESQMRPGGDMEQFQDWAGKAPGAAARLAGVLHAIRHAHGRPWEEQITKETMDDALEIMAVISRHSLAALDMMGTDPTIEAARTLWSWIERHRSAEFSVRDAFNALRSTFPRVRHLLSALDALQERGYVEVVETPHQKPGRPSSPTVRVRPDIQETWR